MSTSDRDYRQTETARPEPGPAEDQHEPGGDPLEEAIERLGAQYIADLKMLTEALNRHLSDQSTTTTRPPGETARSANPTTVPRVASDQPLRGDTEPESRRRIGWRRALLSGVLILIVVGLLGLGLVYFLAPDLISAGPGPPASGQGASLVATSAPVTGSTPAGTQDRVVPTSSPQSNGQLTTSTATVPTPTQAVALVEKVAGAEAGLRSGQFDAVIDYGAGSRASLAISFDFGDGDQPPRLHLFGTYLSPQGEQTLERITKGDRSWQRSRDGPWTAVPEEEGVWGRIQSFLPHAGSAVNPEMETVGAGTVLRWYDPSRNADVTVIANSETGVPIDLRQVSRTTGAVLTVTYRGWNVPVEISNPPEG